MGGGPAFDPETGRYYKPKGLYGRDYVTPAPIADPPPAPDLTDEELRRAQMAALTRLGGAGLSSTFLSGPIGDPMKVATKNPSIPNG